MSDEPDIVERMRYAAMPDDRYIIENLELVASKVAKALQSSNPKTANLIRLLLAKIDQLSAPDMYWSQEDDGGCPPQAPSEWIEEAFYSCGSRVVGPDGVSRWEPDAGLSGVTPFDAARALPTVWVAWRIVLDANGDDIERIITSEHATREKAKAALKALKEGQADE